MTLNHAMYMTMANKSLKRLTVRDPARRVATEKVSFSEKNQAHSQVFF